MYPTNQLNLYDIELSNFKKEDKYLEQKLKDKNDLYQVSSYFCKKKNFNLIYLEIHVRFNNFNFLFQ